MSYNPAPEKCLAIEFALGGGKKLEEYSHLCVSQLNVPTGYSNGIQNMCPETRKRHFVAIIFLLLWLLSGISLFYL